MSSEVFDTRKSVAALSTVNRSKSKQMYSFGKSNRFPNVRGSLCEQNFYDLPSTKNHRSAGFGHGNRFNYKTTRTHAPSNSPFSLSVAASWHLRREGRPAGPSLLVRRGTRIVREGLPAHEQSTRRALSRARRVPLQAVRRKRRKKAVDGFEELGVFRDVLHQGTLLIFSRVRSLRSSLAQVSTSRPFAGKPFNV